MANSPQSIAVIGGGLTGLVAAWTLNRSGHRVTVLERDTEPGGAMGSTGEEGWLYEKGPNSLQETDEVRDLIRALSLEGERQVANPTSRNRYILRDGRLVALPLSPPALLRSPLFSLRARLGVLLELLNRPRVRTTDISVAGFFSSHFGSEIVDYALDPFIAGIYAGDASKLSARYAFPRLWQIERDHGSLLRGFRAQAKQKKTAGAASGPPPIISFRQGLQALPRALAQALPAECIRYSATVSSLIPGKPWKVLWSEQSAVQSAEFDAVILAIPAPALGQLVFGTLGERPLASLDHLPSPPVSSLFLGFKRSQVQHPLDGFGFLVPSREGRSVLGVLFSSSLFPNRAPQDCVALNVFVGGTRQPDLARLDTDQLIDRVMPDLRELLGISGEPIFRHHQFWPKAIPQYNLGHDRFLEPLTQCENRFSRLFIAGNARDGISLPDCIRSGLKAASRVDGR